MPRLLALVLVLGALWGMAEAVWIVAPPLVAIHRLGPATFRHWLVLEAVLLVSSAGLGAFIAVFCAFPLIAWPLVRRRPYRDPGWTIGLALGALVAPGYLVCTLLIEWRYFERVPRVPLVNLVIGVAAYVAAVVALVVTHRHMTSRGRRPTGLAWAVAGVAALGALALLLRLPRNAPAPAIERGSLERVPRRDASTPLLLVGIDSANWDTLRPMLARDALPTIGRLVSNGIHGDVEALWPPFWSAAAWAAILTGYPREQTGTYADLMVRAPGLPLFDAPLEGNAFLNPYFLMERYLLGRNVIEVGHPPRSTLRRPPIWELLTHAGVETGVVRFDFTYPADGQASYVISNRVGNDEWQVALVRAGEGPGTIVPEALRAELSRPFSQAVPFDKKLFTTLLPPTSRPHTARVAFEMDMLRIDLDIDERTLAASEQLLALRPNLPFLAVYLPGLDNVCHAFWQYRFPEAYGAARAPAVDVAEFEGVIERYLQFLDRGLARLIGRYSSAPNVIIVSDHGHVATLDHPVWRGWHGPTGVFIAAGPAFLRRDDPVAVSYFDVVPTVLDVMGFAPPPGIHGSSLRR